MTPKFFNIAGEKIEEEDIPKDKSWVRDYSGIEFIVCESLGMIYVPILKYHNNDLKPDKLGGSSHNQRLELLPYIAARCRSYFLDKAEEHMDDIEARAAYLQSAEKWARIGRTKYESKR